MMANGGKSNGPLFKVSADPNFFGEFELRRADLEMESVLSSLATAGVEGYVELAYERME